MFKKMPRSELFRAILFIILGILFITLMALKKLPLPGTSIQMSLQSLSISLLVITLERKAFSVVLIYLILATIGLPILAGGTSNQFWFLSATGGYYLGFLISSYVLPRLVDIAKPQSFFKAWTCLSFNESVILLSGYMILIFHVGPSRAFWVGVWPYVLGALLKISIATGFYIFKHHLLKKQKSVCSLF